MPQEAYFDAPDLERLILDVRSNPGFVSPGESHQTGAQQHETCCDAGTLAVCKMPALVLWKSTLSRVLATLP